MFILLRRLLAPLGLASLVGCLLPSAASATEQETLRAFSAWQSRGQIVRTGPNEATYMGMLSGRFYIDTEQGPVDAGTIICPVVMRVNLKDNTQKGTGSCELTGPQGNKAYMELACAGVPLVGCAGESKLTGGTGRLANLSGSGHFIMRSSLHGLAVKPDTTLEDTITGIIFWRELHYTIP
jgi:hypothetical protein